MSEEKTSLSSPCCNCDLTASFISLAVRVGLSDRFSSTWPVMSSMPSERTTVPRVTSVQFISHPVDLRSSCRRHAYSTLSIPRRSLARSNVLRCRFAVEQNDIRLSLTHCFVQTSGKQYLLLGMSGSPLFSLCLCLSRPLSPSPSVSLCLCLSVPLSLCASVSAPLSLCFCLCASFSVPLSLCRFPSSFVV